MKPLLDISSRIDPELVDILGATPSGLDLAQTREKLRTISQMLADALPGPKPATEDLEIPATAGNPAVPVRIFRPRDGATGSLLLWMHGGGFIAGDHCADAVNVIPFVQATGCTVVSVGYRLAPENPAPAAFDDCYAALCWAASQATTIVGRPLNKLAVGGMSAGGCVAAAVVQAARDRQGPKIDFQLLLIPALDNRNQTVSSHQIADPRVWNRSRSLAAWEMYAGANFREETSPYIAPARAVYLGGLPSTFIEIAEVDLLRDEAIEYGMRLMQAGVTTEMHIYPGAYHASSVIQANAVVSRQARSDILAALNRALA